MKILNTTLRLTNSYSSEVIYLISIINNKKKEKYSTRKIDSNPMWGLLIRNLGLLLDKFTWTWNPLPTSRPKYTTTRLYASYSRLQKATQGTVRNAM